ncbi:hypothetical protein ACVIJ6_005525 [Bradyrhizobium sp. USDA 4369]
MKVRHGPRRREARRSGSIKALGMALAAFAVTTQPSLAGSITANTNTYAGDVGGIEFPVGTVAVSTYAGYRHQSTFFDGAGLPAYASFDLYTMTSRVDWRAADIQGHPLLISFGGSYANPRNITFAGTDNSSVATWFAPTVFATFGLIADASHERDLAISNFVFFDAGRYDGTKAINIAPPRGQTTDVVQLTYQEGLRKFTPALANFWFDAFGGVAFHTDAGNPITDPATGLGFAKTTQTNSYNANAYLRYSWNELGFAAVGLERSWGGKQTAFGGPLGDLLGPQVISRDDYLKGHLQFGIPLGDRMQLAADLTHDFSRKGGFKEDFTAELRLVVLFAPSTSESSDKPAPTYLPSRGR